VKEKWFMVKKHRVQFNFTEDLIGEIDELIDELGYTSRAELLRQSARLMKRLHAYQKDGAVIQVREKDGTIKQLMIIF